MSLNFLFTVNIDLMIEFYILLTLKNHQNMKYNDCNPKLLADGIYITTLALSHVILKNDSEVLWFVLVPQSIEPLVDLIDLPTSVQNIWWEEVRLVSQFIKENDSIDKINIANLGNIVSQLHLHIIGRKKSDRAWPHPIWGQPCTPQTEEQLLITKEKFLHFLTIPRKGNV